MNFIGVMTDINTSTFFPHPGAKVRLCDQHQAPTVHAASSENFYGLKVMTWNIKRLTNNQTAVPWKTRKEHIIATLSESLPDIIVVQEVLAGKGAVTLREIVDGLNSKIENDKTWKNRSGPRNPCWDGLRQITPKLEPPKLEPGTPKREPRVRGVLRPGCDFKKDEDPYSKSHYSCVISDVCNPTARGPECHGNCPYLFILFSYRSIPPPPHPLLTHTPPHTHTSRIFSVPPSFVIVSPYIITGSVIGFIWRTDIFSGLPEICLINEEKIKLLLGEPEGRLHQSIPNKQNAEFFCDWMNPVRELFGSHDIKPHLFDRWSAEIKVKFCQNEIVILSCHLSTSQIQNYI